MTADPRSIVTPDAFSVSPALLGTPLAEPWRRFVALMLDLLLIFFVQLLGWRVLGGVAALMLFRMATRRPDGTAGGPARKVALGCAGTLVLVVAVGLTSVIPIAINRILPGDGAVPAAVGGEGEVSAGELLRGALQGIAGARDLATAENEDEALEAALVLGQAMVATGIGREEILATIESLVEDNTDFNGAALARRVDDTLFGEAPGAGVLADAAAEAALPPADVALRDTIAELRDRLAESESDLSESRDETREALAEAEAPSTLFTWIRDAADEAGLIFGWGTVYLTLFLALWQGRTPGKKVMGLRVVRLNGQPIGLYLSLERAGGYAAGVATGLLGFAQLWWDPNRQAIHDKIAETVVIREGLPNRLTGEHVSGEGVAEAVAGRQDWSSARTAAPAGDTADAQPDSTGGHQA